jgi:transcriptional regulator with XRE-family HTH domain
MASCGWSQEDLAKAAGLAAGTISNAVSGRPVTARTLARIAGALAREKPVDGIEELLVAGDS